MIKLPIGNCAIIISKQNPEKFVAVYRKENSEKVCLPGGKLDPGENTVEAVAREVYEETGLVIPLTKFQPIYCGVCEGQKEYWITVYMTLVDETVDLNSPEPEMRPFWTVKEHFMENTSFPIFNAKIFEVLEQLK